MKKKENLVGIVGGIFILFLILEGRFSNLAAEEKEGNAAIHYLKAIKLMDYPVSIKRRFEIQEAIKKGWSAEAKELEKILQKNEKALNELKKGLEYKRCDFNLGKKYKYSLEKNLPPFLEIFNLSNLLLLKGRYYEKEAENKKALDTYLSSLTFAYHISLSNDTPSKTLALTIEENALPLLKNYLNLADKEDCLKISAFIKDFLNKHFSMEEVIKGEKEFFISNLQIIVDKVKTIKETQDEIKRKKKKFIQKLVEEGNKLLDDYYGALTKAVESNEDEDWQVVEDKSLKLREDIKYLNRESLGKTIKEGTEKLDENLAPKIAEIVLIMNLPDIRRISDKYYSVLRSLEDILKKVNTIKETLS